MERSGGTVIYRRGEPVSAVPGVEAELPSGSPKGGRPGPFSRAWRHLEALLERVGGREANLFAWSGPMAVGCFVLIVVSGLYLYLFYQVGSSAGYASVAAMDQSLLGSGMRALHRYASRGFMIFALIHMVRYLLSGRFRGARWLPWVTGLLMLGLAWFVGVVGYLLVWDSRAFLATEVLASWLDAVGLLGQPISFSLLSPESLKENVFLVLLYLHITLPLLGVIFGWLHLTRVARPRLLPHWGIVGVSFVAYVVLSLVLPLETLPQADPSRTPPPFQVDPFYLAYLLLPRNLPQWVAGGVLVASLVALALPWIGRKRRVSLNVDADRCIGCGFCAADCPFGAIRMEPTDAGRRLAKVVPSRCTDCGVCVGACPTGGIDLEFGSSGVSTYLAYHLGRFAEGGVSRLVVHCAGHTVRLNHGEAALELPCAASMPLWTTRYLARRGIALRVVPCGHGVCPGREGADLVAERALRRRYPFWPRKLAVGLSSRLLEQRSWASVGAGSALAVLLVAISLWQGPRWEGSGSVLKVAVRAEAPFLWSHVLSEAEREKLLPHMRIDQPVAGRRADLQLWLVVGNHSRELVLSPVGLHRDGPTYYYMEIPLDPGSYEVQFVLAPVGSGEQVLAQWHGQLQVDRGQVRVLSYGVLGPELVVR